MTDTGRIHIYYGDGKGKTTAAMGLLMRAAGYGRKILVYQFLKDNSSGERAVLEALPTVTCLPGRDRVKFYSQMNSEEKAEAAHYNNKALDEIVKFCSPFDMLLLDEALCAVTLGLLNEDKLLSFLEHKPERQEVILTGHEASDRIIQAADYATKMHKIKHPYDIGIKARPGIEY